MSPLQSDKWEPLSRVETKDSTGRKMLILTFMEREQEVVVPKEVIPLSVVPKREVALRNLPNLKLNEDKAREIKQLLASQPKSSWQDMKDIGEMFGVSPYTIYDIQSWKVLD